MTMEPHDEVEQAVAAFAQAADHRDVAGLEAILARDFRVVFGIGDAAPVTMARAQYFDLVRAGKTGGADRTVQIHSVRRAGAFAMAAAHLERSDAAFEGVYTFVREGGGWRLLQEAVHMTPRRG